MLTFPSHAAGAYLAIELVSSVDPGLGLGKPSVIGLGVIAGMISDLDGLFYIGRLRDHHDTPLHTPFFWLVIFIMLFGVNQVAGWDVQSYILAGFIGIASHLFLDWYAGRVAGMRLLYPFSKQRYSLFPLQREKGVFSFKSWSDIKTYFRFYASNRFLLISEVGLVVIAALSLAA